MLKKYLNANFLNTSDEAYSDKIFVGNNSIAIPYVNIELMPDNPITGKKTLIDHSYCVFTGVQSILFNAEKGSFYLEFSQMHDINFKVHYVLVGGFKNDNSAEVKITSADQQFYLCDNSRFSQAPLFFLPVDTPNFKRNMDVEKVESFFSLQALPAEIKDLLGGNIISLMLK